MDSENRRQADLEADVELDRRQVDGAAGAGDMLGGLNTGAGGRLGPDADPTDEQATPNQHSFEDAEFATDSTYNYHGGHDPR